MPPVATEPWYYCCRSIGTTGVPLHASCLISPRPDPLGWCASTASCSRWPSGDVQALAAEAGVSLNAGYCKGARHAAPPSKVVAVIGARPAGPQPSREPASIGAEKATYRKPMVEQTAIPARIGPGEFSTLGALVALRCPSDLDLLMLKDGGVREPGSRRWLIERRRMGPLIRNLRRDTDPRFRQAG
jgi:hypothetical protein